MAFERRREDAFEDTGTKSEASSRLVSVRGVQNRNLATRSNAAGDARKTRRLRDAKTRSLPRRLARVLRRDASDAAAAPAVPRDDVRDTRHCARVGRQHVYKGRKQARSRLGGDGKYVRDGVRRSGARRATRATRRRSGCCQPGGRARFSALLRWRRARWRANDADAEQTRRRLGKVWSDAVARTTAVAFGFPGFSGSGVSGAELERTLERTASGKTFPGKPPLRDDRFEKQTTERASASTTPGGSPARVERAATPRAPPARRPGPGGGGGAIRFFSRRGNQAESSASSPTTRPESVFFPRPVPVARSDGFRSARSSMPQLSERLARALGGGVAGEGADSAAGPRRDATGRGRAVPRGDRRGGGAPRSARARRRRARGERRNVVVGVVVALAGEAERRARGRRRGRVAGPTAEFERDAGDARALRYKVREGRARAYELLRRVYYHSRRGVRVSVSAVFDTSQNFILHVWQKSVTFKTCAATEKASADDACVRPLGGAPSPQRRRSISIRDRTRAHHTLASRRAIARVSR